MSDNTYNGWIGDGTLDSAKATWNLGLWIDNDYTTYKARLAADTSTPEACEAFARGIYPNGETPDEWKLDMVNWTEICEHWAAE